MKLDKQFYRKALITAVLMTITAIVIIPFLWMLTMSFRNTLEILKNPNGLPKSINFSNYIRLMGPKFRFYRYIFNSTIVTVFGILLTLTLSTMGGYGFGRKRFKFPFREALLTVLLFSLMLPPQAMYIPQYLMMNVYGLLNTRMALILVYAAYGITISTYLLKTYFSLLPEELEESARIDGAKDVQIFLTIMLPLTRPAIATVILVNFMQMWNELLLAMTLITTPVKRTLPLAMMNFVGENNADYAMAASSLVVGLLPILLIYLFLSERFIAGLTAGAVKG